MANDEVTLPNWEEWARLNFPRMSDTDKYRIANYLQQVFDKGYHLGLNQGWAIEQDRDACVHEYIASSGHYPQSLCSKCGREQPPKRL